MFAHNQSEVYGLPHSHTQDRPVSDLVEKSLKLLLSHAELATSFRSSEVNGLVHIIQGLQRSAALPQDPALDPKWSRLTSLVRDEFLTRNGKDIVELLERALLRLRHKEEDHEECGDVESGVEAKSSHVAESC